ncbi:MAG: hypothetical protein E6J20_08755 [Chloroflexi bacterium]|nr:MAG: hypothetical protein E6J20_08755 [Chloroflexota bacterium]
MVRIWAWARIVFGVLAIGVGLAFLLGLAIIWFQARSDISQYQAATECEQLSSSCYQTLPGTVTGANYESTSSGTSGSITVRTARATEDIAVGNINLARDDVHAGDQVSVRYWQGKARLLIIHEDDFPTVDDPASELSSTPSGVFLFGLITAFGVAGLGTGIWSLRRRKKLALIRPQSAAGLPIHQFVGPTASESDPQSLVLLPSRRRVRTPRLLLGAFVVGLLVKAAIDSNAAIRGHGWAAVGVDAILILAFAAGVPVLLLAFYKTSRIFIGRHVVTLTGLGGKSCDRAAVTRIVQVSSRTAASVPIPMALLLDRDDRVLLRVSRAFDIAALGHELNVPVQGNWETAPADELARRYPGSVSQFTVNAGALGAGIAIVIMVVVVIAVFTFHLGVQVSH